MEFGFYRVSLHKVTCIHELKHQVFKNNKFRNRSVIMSTIFRRLYVVFYICFLPSFLQLHYTSYSNDSRPICDCIVFSLDFLLSSVCQLVLKNYDDDDDDDAPGRQSVGQCTV